MQKGRLSYIAERNRLDDNAPRNSLDALVSLLMARSILDKLNIIGDDKTGHYMFDRDIMNFNPPEPEAQ